MSGKYVRTVPVPTRSSVDSDKLARDQDAEWYLYFPSLVEKVLIYQCASGNRESSSLLEFIADSSPLILR